MTQIPILTCILVGANSEDREALRSLVGPTVNLAEVSDSGCVDLARAMGAHCAVVFHGRDSVATAYRLEHSVPGLRVIVTNNTRSLSKITEINGFAAVIDSKAPLAEVARQITEVKASGETSSAMAKLSSARMIHSLPGIQSGLTENVHVPERLLEALLVATHCTRGAFFLRPEKSEHFEVAACRQLPATKRNIRIAAHSQIPGHLSDGLDGIDDEETPAFLKNHLLHLGCTHALAVSGEEGLIGWIIFKARGSFDSDDRQTLQAFGFFIGESLRVWQAGHRVKQRNRVLGQSLSLSCDATMVVTPDEQIEVLVDPDSKLALKSPDGRQISDLACGRLRAEVRKCLKGQSLGCQWTNRKAGTSTIVRLQNGSVMVAVVGHEKVAQFVDTSSDLLRPSWADLEDIASILSDTDSKYGTSDGPPLVPLRELLEQLPPKRFQIKMDSLARKETPLSPQAQRALASFFDAFEACSKTAIKINLESDAEAEWRMEVIGETGRDTVPSLVSRVNVHRYLFQAASLTARVEVGQLGQVWTLQMPKMGTWKDVASHAVAHNGHDVIQRNRIELQFPIHCGIHFPSEARDGVPA